MDIDYAYAKLRVNFGSQCLFQNDGPKIIQELRPDKSMMEKYIYKNPVDKSVQTIRIMAEHDANTFVKEFSDHGVNHLEGGWPKDLDTTDDEAILRYRKKIERQDNYIAVMKHLLPFMEHAVLQNNAVNIYEQYYANMIDPCQRELETCRIQSKFRDMVVPSRPITSCCWSPEGTEFACSYCNTQFQRSVDTCFDSFIWNVETPGIPVCTLQASAPMLCLEYNSRDSNGLACGLASGQVAFFDIRKGVKPIEVSPFEVSHRDPTHSLLWISSKSGMEFFTTSSDGTIKWWDCRKLVQPIDYLILDLSRGEKPVITKANAASCLEYENSIPVKFMVGTETGYVITGNRKGQNHQEKLPLMIKCHLGPVYSVHRNQAFSKNFLTVGDWSAKIWSEDCKESPIMWTKYHDVRLTAGAWSPGRLSAFFLTREDGVLDIWDILMNQQHAVLSLPLSNHPLTALRVKEDGILVLAGTSEGTVYLVRYPSNLAESLKNEKTVLAAMFDRENRREKVLETKNKEIKLRLRELALAKEAMEAEDTEERPKTEQEIQTERYKSTLETDYLAEVEAYLAAYEKRKAVPVAEEQD